MVNMEETARIRMTGGPPWGFRLVGGIEHGLPVSVSKIRKKSKADYANLQEGDRVLSINGKTVRNAARDVAMAYIDDADDSLDLEIARTSSRNSNSRSIQMNQDQQTLADRRVSNGSLPPNTAVRKVTTTTTRIKTTKDGERLQETVTKTVTESLDGETPKTVSETKNTRDELVGPVRKQSGFTEHTAPIKMDHGRRTSDVTVTTPQTYSTNQRPRLTGNVTVGQPATITIQNPSKPSGTWQPAQRQPSASKQQPVYTQPATRQQPVYQQPQKAKPKFEMPKGTENPRYQAPGPRQEGFSIQYRKPESFQKPKTSQQRPPLIEKQPAYEPVSIKQSKAADKAGTVGKELTITFAMPDQTPSVEFGSPPQSPSGMSVDSGLPPESPLTPKKHLAAEEEDEDDGRNVLRDPSIILRSLAKDQPPPERLLRPFSEPAGRVTEEPEVSIVEKRRACKTIADLLMFPKNKQAKGARMFAKRRKRSARYTIEAIGQRDSDEESEESSEAESGAAIITIKTAAPPPPPPPIPGQGIPAPPPPPPGGFTQRIRVEPTNFNIKLKSKEKCEHNVVTPKQCLVLADSLKSHSGKAAEMFEKRRLRSEQFVLDESTMKNPKKPATFKKPPGPQALASTSANIEVKGVKKLTPWEAASESPTGSVSRAFPPKEVKIPPSTEPKPKPPAAWMKTSNMTPEIPAKPPAEPRIKPGFKANRDLPKYPASQGPDSIPLQPGGKLPKANFKDFNTKARGWGSRSSGENTPGSPASVNSDQGIAGRSQIPTRPLKYSGGYNDFNPKPRAFNTDSPRHGALSPTTSLAESDDL